MHILILFLKGKTNQASKYAGTAGMLLIIGGIVGSLVGGYILDKSKAYKYRKICLKNLKYLFSFILKIEK